MPTYEFICNKCGEQTDLFMTVKAYSSFAGEQCVCGGGLERTFVTPGNFSIPAHMSHDGQIKVSGGKGPDKEARVPINIIDENPDGSYKVTRIGKKKDIDND